MKHYVILWNPYAGNGRAVSEIQTLKERLADDRLSFYDMTTLTSYETLFASLEPSDLLLICGGDGTLNRFVNDTKGLSIANPIYYYPSGSGNDFLRDIPHTENQPVEITAYLENLPIVEVDGKSYRFLNGVGYGIDGYCCEEGDKERAKGNKKINYTAIAIKGCLFKYSPTDATVTVDGKTERYRKVWLAPAMHGHYYGGGMMPTPAQDRNDPDHLSLMLFHGSGRLKTLMIFPGIFEGKHVEKEKYVKVLTGKEITVEFDRPTALQVDGETILGVTKYTAYTADHANAKAAQAVAHAN